MATSTNKPESPKTALTTALCYKMVTFSRYPVTASDSALCRELIQGKCHILTAFNIQVFNFNITMTTGQLTMLRLRIPPLLYVTANIDAHSSA